MSFIITDNAELADLHAEWTADQRQAPEHRTVELPEGHTFRQFAAYNLATFTDRIAKLARRADKLGVDAPTFEQVGTREVRYTDEAGRKHTERAVVVYIRTTPVRLSGYRFVATIQHAGELGNLIRTQPGIDVELPHEFRTAEATWCDHCRTNRRRNDTFVVQHTDGDLLRIGRNCLASFIGSQDGNSAANGLGFYTAVAGLLDECDGWGYGGGEPVEAIEAFVAQCQRCVTTDGWVSRTKAREASEYNPVVATADLALGVINARRKPTKYNVDLCDERYHVTDADREFATAAIEWAQAIPEDTDSDYLHNLRVACSFAGITRREAGIVGSVVAAYGRELGRELARQREAALPPRGLSHFGNPGDKIGRKLSTADKRKGVDAHEAMVATVTNLRTFDGDYGVRTLVTMEHTTDTERLVLTWWKSGEVADTIERGTEVELVGTIKRHSDYKGTKQTELTRCVLTPA